MREIILRMSLIVNLRSKIIKSYSFRALSSYYMRKKFWIIVTTFEMNGDHARTKGNSMFDLMLKCGLV